MTADLPKRGRVVDLATHLHLAASKFRHMILPKRRPAAIPTQDALPATTLAEFVGWSGDIHRSRLLTGIRDDVRTTDLHQNSIVDDLQHMYTIDDLSTARRLAYKLARVKSIKFIADLITKMVRRARRLTRRA